MNGQAKRNGIAALCYAGVALVIGGLLAAIGLANMDPALGADNAVPSAIRSLGGLGLSIGIVGLIYGLCMLARAAQSDG